MWKLSRAEIALVVALCLLAAAAATWRIARHYRSSGPPVGLSRSSDLGNVKIDLNTAPWWEIAWLPGIAETRAKSIVKYRDAHGPFNSPDELARVPGISQRLVATFKDQITFSGVTSDGSPSPTPAE